MANEERSLKAKMTLAFDRAGAQRDMQKMIDDIPQRLSSLSQTVAKNVNEITSNTFKPEQFKQVFDNLEKYTGLRFEKISEKAQDALDWSKISPEISQRKIKNLINELSNLDIGKEFSGEEGIKRLQKTFNLPSQEDARKWYQEDFQAILGQFDLARKEAVKTLQGAQTDNKGGRNKWRDHMGSFGLYFLSSEIGNVISQFGQVDIASTMLEGQKYAREQTAFDYRSALGNYQARVQMQMQNKLQEAEFEAMKKRMVGSGVGMGLGTIIGGVVGGYIAPGAGIVPGAYVGGQIGGAIGGWLGGKEGAEVEKKTIEENARKQAQLMKDVQLVSLMEEYYKSYSQMDVQRAMMRARYGTLDTGGQGLGYSETELLELAYQQGSVTGKFDKSSFKGQLAFSRAYGFSPQEIFNSSFTARYTGQEVGAGELMSRRELAQISGMGTRLPELLQSMNQVAVMMSQLVGNVSEKSLFAGSLLPTMLWGDSPRGRLSDLGMQQLQKLQATLTPEMGSPQQIALMRAYMTGAYERGDATDLGTMADRLETGLADPNNLKDMLTYGLKYAQGDKGRFKNIMSALSRGQLKRVGDIGTMFDNLQGYMTESGGDVNKGIDAFFKEYSSKLEQLLTPEEQSAKSLEILQKLAEEQTPETKKFYATMEDMKIYLGELASGKVQEMQMRMMVIQAEAIEKWVSTSDGLKRVLDDMWNLMHPAGVGTSTATDDGKVPNYYYGMDNVNTLNRQRSDEETNPSKKIELIGPPESKRDPQIDELIKAMNEYVKEMKQKQSQLKTDNTQPTEIEDGN